MTLEVKHKFQSAVPDGADTSVVRPSNWNDTHNITLAAQRLIGRAQATAGDAGEVALGRTLAFANGALVSTEFDSQAAWVGHYRKVLFDTPDPGVITEEIRVSADDTLVATRVTQFDTPTAGNITITSQIGASLPIVSVIAFDGDDITETIEVQS